LNPSLIYWLEFSKGSEKFIIWVNQHLFWSELNSY
jgi:hypothetical protein